MSDRMRITGMNSGLDTESIVQQLVAAKQIKVDNLKNDQKKLEWKQTAWQDLNSKIYNLYSNTLSKLRLTGAYKKKKVSSSDTTKATVSATSNAVDGTQTLEVKKLAKTASLTSAKVSRLEYRRMPVEVDENTKLEDLGIETELGYELGISLNTNAPTAGATVKVEAGETVGSFIQKINDAAAAEGIAGFSLSFDATNGVINVTGPSDGSKYKLTSPYTSSSGLVDTTLVDALGLGNVFKNNNSVTGDHTGSAFTKMELVKAEDVVGTKETELVKDLKIKAGSKLGISVNAQDPTVWVEVKAGETVEDFVNRFNTEAASTGVKMSFADGALTVSGPADGSKYKLTQGWKKEDDGSIKIPQELETEIIDALGLSDIFENDNSVAGTHTGSSFKTAVAKPAPLKAEDTLDSIANLAFTGHEITVKVGTGADATKTKIKLSGDMKISDFVSELKKAGLNASFDEAQQRFYISSKKSGTASDFTITDDTADGSVLSMLGLVGGDSNKIAAQDAEIVLNGTTYTDTKNTFSINGLTINATGVTDGEIMINTTTDYQSAYDTIKDFLTEYNDLINEMDKLYNADSARKYNMLSADEKEAMSDEEVEKWENTIKDSLLRKDVQLSSVMSTMTQAMLKTFDINGKKVGLSTFGIKTLGYFTAKDNEHHAYHIDGDEDDENTRDKDDKLMKALTEDPEGTIQFFADLCKNLYGELDKTMSRSTEYSSIYKVYNDKQLQKDYDNYTKKIKDAEDKLSAYEDKWYDKFSKMETALSKLQSNQSIVSSMLGSN
ncbi:MAG: flagellar filament capping protein FliD [Lachnospiraceae bacterium]|nr:flagellar filament capping protein FliD [Lachnospiraceae bacterium]